MRENWKYLPLGEICEFISGFTPQKHELNEKEGVPYYKVSDMNRDVNSLYMNETDLFVAHPRKTIPANSIIFPKNGGAIFTGKKRILKYDSIIDLNTEAINIKDKNIDLQFLYSFLLGIDFGQFDNGGGLPSINIRKMKEFIVPIPPLSEQERIVSLLNTQFAKIDQLKANAATQLQAAKDLFQSALKEMLTPQEGWEKGCIGSIATILHGKNQKEVEDPNGKYPIYGSGGNIMGYSNEYLCEEGTTILGRKGTINNPTYISEKFWNVDTAFGICAKKGVDKRFLYYIVKSINWQEKNTGTTLPSLTQTVVLSVPISFPSLPEQERIAARLDAISEKVKALQANYDQTITLCNDLKQSLLKSIFA
ncbi:MAG: restriction endonuclease subunit S [Paludibacteraceae bacterium]|nr:restriction endonuclease subunit S [Paludibacteraceae bacterium]MBQ8705155.1 restriction endonuclease subunit S [Paludibacteraceae bacterium]